MVAISNSVTLKLAFLKVFAQISADLRDTSLSEPYPPFTNKTCILFFILTLYQPFVFPNPTVFQIFQKLCLEPFELVLQFLEMLIS